MTSVSAGAESRIKAAVIAAPAVGFAFAPDGLKNVKVPMRSTSGSSDACAIGVAVRRSRNAYLE